MKKYILLILLAYIACSVSAQSKLSTENLKVEHNGAKVEISFEFSAEISSFSINNTYTFTPILYSDKGMQRLAPIIIGSHRSKILNERRGIATDGLRRRGDTINYTHTLPYQAWMEGSLLSIVEEIKGCCLTKTFNPVLIAENLMHAPKEVVPSARLLPDKPLITESTGKRFANKYPFIAPLTELNGALDFALPLKTGKATTQKEQDRIDRYLEENEESSSKIYYRLAKSVIDPAFTTNGKKLERIAEAIKAINNSADSRVTDIVIAGFASPEGPITLNERLAYKRALSLKEYILKNTDMKAEKIHLYNGGENWMELRKWVTWGAVKDKKEVLRIIDNVPMNKGREKQLKDLSNGDSFKFMAKHFFPILRYAAYIKVYYEDIKRDNSQIK